MKIKTRESLITIKIFNKAETLAQKSKNCVSTLAGFVQKMVLVDISVHVIV